MHKWFRGPFTEPESEDEAYERWRSVMDDNAEESMSETPRIREETIAELELREANAAAERWWKAASPYATPEALKEALDKLRAAEERIAQLIAGAHISPSAAAIEQLQARVQELESMNFAVARRKDQP